MLGDPCLGVRFGFELADRGRITVRDGYLDTERPVVKRDYTIGRLGVGVSFWHFMQLDREHACPERLPEAQARKWSGNSFSAPHTEQLAVSRITR